VSNGTRVRTGAVVWICAVQFFVVQAVVQSAWTTPYSLSENFISDLGNTTCGPYPYESVVYVCSPLHAWMNASFVLLGAIILVGAALVWRALVGDWVGVVGLALVVLAGPGLILVGLYPEDVAITPHKVGAGAQFVLGNLGLVVLGIALLGRGRIFALFSIVAGAAGLVATVLLVEEIYLGLGIGGMERIAAYTIPVWLIVAGVWLLGNPRIHTNLHE
jgi:hypothetical membrane protein